MEQMQAEREKIQQERAANAKMLEELQALKAQLADSAPLTADNPEDRE